MKVQNLRFISLIIILSKEPVGKPFFIVFRFVICEVLSIKVSNSLAQAL